MTSSQIVSPEGKEDVRRRIVLNLVFHVGSAMIAFGIVIAILGEPGWPWAVMAIGLGVAIWMRVFRTMHDDIKKVKKGIEKGIIDRGKVH